MAGVVSMRRGYSGGFPRGKSVIFFLSFRSHFKGRQGGHDGLRAHRAAGADPQGSRRACSDLLPGLLARERQEGRIPDGVRQGLRRQRLAWAHDSRGLWRRGPGRHRGRPHAPRDLRLGRRHLGRLAHPLLLLPTRARGALRDGRAQAARAPEDRDGRDRDGLRRHRAQRGHTHRARPDAGREEGRWLACQRAQGVDHQRAARQSHPAPRAHERPRSCPAAQGHDPLLHRVRPPGHHGAPDREARPRRRGLQRDLHRQPRGARGRRGRHGGRRLLSPDRLPQSRAYRDRHRGRGHRAGRPRARGPVRQGARRLRPAHREEPGHRASPSPRPRPARRRGDDVSQGGLALRHGPAVRARGQCRQAPRRRSGLSGLRRGPADVWRLRLRQGVPRRAPVARDPTLQDRAHLAADGPELPLGARAGAAPLVLMALTLSTIDRSYDAPDADTIAKVLGSLDGRRDVFATLAHAEETYLQATGSATAGFTLTNQQGSLTQRYRSVGAPVILERTVEIFAQYSQGDERWRQAMAWEPDQVDVPQVTWYESWLVYIVGFSLVIALFVWWRGWW